MATAGTITVDLKAKTAQFDTDIQRTRRQLERQFKDMEKAAKAAGVVIGAAFVGAGVGLAALVKRSIDFGDEMQKMAARTGVSVESLSRLSVSAKLSDTSMQSLSTSIGKLSKFQADAARGTKEQVDLFDALGIEVKNADGTLRASEQVLLDVADVMKDLGPGTDRTALAMKLFGRSGMELIPMLQGGRAGIEGMNRVADELGVTLDGNTAAAAERFNDHLSMIGLAVQGVGNRLAVELLPQMEDLAAKLSSEEFRVGFANIAEGAVVAAAKVADLIAATGSLVTQIAEDTAAVVGGRDRFDVDGLERDLARLQTAQEAGFSGFANGQWLWSDEVPAEIERVTGLLEEARAAQDALGASAGGASADIGELEVSTRANSDALRDYLKDQTQATSAQREADQARRRAIQLAKENEQRLKDEAGAVRQLQDILLQYSGTMSGPMLQAVQQNLAEQRALDEAFEVLLESSTDLVAAYDLMAAAQEAVTKAAENRIRTAEQEEDIVGNMLAQMESELSLMRMSGPALAGELAVRDALNEAMRKGTTLAPERLAFLRAEAEEIARTADIIQAQEQIASEWRGIWQSAGDGVHDSIVTALFDGAKEGGDRLMDVMEQLARDLVKFWLQQQFQINLTANASGQGGGGFGGLMQMFGGGGGGGMGGFGSALPWLAAAGGAYYGLTQRGNGGASSLAAGASYAGLGYVGATLGAGALAGAGAATAATAGAGAYAAGSAAVGGAAAGASTAAMAIPIVGWVLAIAAIVDLVSGGKLFGTKFRPEEVEQQLSIGAGGGEASATMTSVRNRSWFRGREWDTESLEVGDEAQEAAQAFYAQVAGAMEQSAQMLGADIIPVIDAQIRTITEYDKKGREKGTKILVDVIGRTWEEASAELASTRIIGEAIIAQVSASAAEANTIAERWRDSAETLLAGAQFLLVAQSDINAGVGLLGEAGEGALTAVTEFVEAFAFAGETLDQTYGRISASVGLLDQALGMMGVTLDGTRESVVVFALDIAEAAGGLERASALWSGFMDQFFTETERLAIALSQAQAPLQAEFTDIGLDASQFTGEGGAQAFRALFTELLPTLSAEAVVQWLEAANALGVVIQLQDAYATSLEATAPIVEAALFDIAAAVDYAAQVADMDRQIAELSGATEFQLSLQDIAAEFGENTARLNELARAAGLSAAREKDLARAHTLAAMQAARAMDQLRQAGAELAADLYGTPLSRIEAQIAELEGQGFTGERGIQAFGQAMQRAGRMASDVAGAMLGEFSPLRGEEKADFALRALADGAVSLDAALQAGRDVYASGRDFNEFFQRAIAIAGRGQQEEQTPQQQGQQFSAALRDLLEQRDLLLGAQDANNRFGQANSLAQVIADIAGFGGESFESIAEGFGFSLEQLAADLRLEDVGALEEFLTAMQADSYQFEELFSRMTADGQAIVSTLERIFGIENPVLDGPLPVAGPDDSGMLPTPEGPYAGDGPLPGDPLDSTTYKPPHDEPQVDPAKAAEDQQRDARAERIESLLERMLPMIAAHTGATAGEMRGLNARANVADLEERGQRPRAIRRTGVEG